ncbi:unnamed protein product [Leptosia nina]|uniref:Uncharacterized protein n=1 Tax=Leptosia nina TaxID=320188 RepID=A0AAV1JT67_9NEOP
MALKELLFVLIICVVQAISEDPEGTTTTQRTVTAEDAVLSGIRDLFNLLPKSSSSSGLDDFVQLLSNFLRTLRSRSN